MIGDEFDMTSRSNGWR